jgi:hypothetical protein
MASPPDSLPGDRVIAADEALPVMQDVTVVSKINRLSTTADGFEVYTQGTPTAGIESCKIRVPSTHPNYNAHFSLLLTASFNRYLVDFEIQRPRVVVDPRQANTYSLVSATVLWTELSSTPNPR